MHIKRQECGGLAQSGKMKRKCQLMVFVYIIFGFHMLSYQC